MRRDAVTLTATVSALAVVAAPLAEACTRFTYQTADGGFLVGRSMDWNDEPDSELWVFPAGLERDGGVGADSLQSTSKYGSVILSFYDAASVDGMNEAGLGANHLYLAVADNGAPHGGATPALSIGAELSSCSTTWPRSRRPWRRCATRRTT